MTDLAQAGQLVSECVAEYNTHRLHGALHRLMPAGYLDGPWQVDWRLAGCRVALAATGEHRHCQYSGINLCCPEQSGRDCHPDQRLPPTGATWDRDAVASQRTS